MTESAYCKRTIYSIDLSPELDTKQVTVLGWVASIRRQGGITFLLLRDKEGEMQITVKKDSAPDSLVKKVQTLKQYSSVGVKGTVRRTERAPHGAEVIPSELTVLAVPRRLPPFNLFAKKSLPNIDKRFDLRGLDLRRPQAQAMFRVRALVLRSIREFFNEKGYLEVNTPKIIASATEGGASLFPLLYYDREAFLAQSPQLYKEQLVMAFEKVFEIAPAFRAELSRTPLHLSEFISVDLEEAYTNCAGVMNVLEAMILRSKQTLAQSNDPLIADLNLKMPPTAETFRRYKYDEVLDMVRRKGIDIDWGDDLSTEAMEVLVEYDPGFYFITDWPSVSKPFYIQPHQDRGEITESFDLMYGAMEIASGGTRVHSKNVLMKRLREKKLKPKSFEYHLKVFDYGMPPHAGFGLGLERYLLALTGEENIREVTFFPRDQRRLTP